MIGEIARKVFGTPSDRFVKRLSPLLQKINSLEETFRPLDLEALKNKTFEYRERAEKGESLDSLLPEAFATVRAASEKVFGMRHFDVQMIGGIVLHQGRVAEMRTGEGKTLAATLPAYLNAIASRGVHVITVNDYLAQRDSEWMGQLYNALGLSVGCVVHGISDQRRRESYRADITYGTNNEFGFDYLRDNMKFRLEDYVQRELNYCIVDEVDSILIDEARTPLIISGPTEDSTEKYFQINSIIPSLKKDEDYTVEEKSKSASLTEEGVVKVEAALGVPNMYAPEHLELVHHVHQALKAHAMFKKDIDYVVKEGQVLIVDEFTGRLMPGRRYSDGLHQALEAKEGVTIESENQTLATITFQNYFRMYNKLSGMTGTAETEAVEFGKIYNLDVIVIPTNKPMIRKDEPDVVYKGMDGKYQAICEDIRERNKKGQPVLVGTTSIESSEKISRFLKAQNVAHNVLNAKQHEKEAEIVANAGHEGAVTIATNMAGRGTDIVLGPGVKEKGGLHIIGTERNESRRIDNQLRGRSGRQGDPGSSRFYLSLDDDLLRIFQGDKIKGYMERFNMEEDVPIESGLISRAIENAQKKVEAHNFDIRKHLLQYDDVLNKQREVIYELRKLVLSGESTRDLVLDIIGEQVDGIVESYAATKLASEWDVAGLREALVVLFDDALGVGDDIVNQVGSPDELKQVIRQRAQDIYLAKEQRLGAETLRQLEQYLYLGTIDQLWKDHLLNMDHLKEGVGLRGYGQKDPLVEYKREGFHLFQAMDEQVRADVISKLYRVEIQEPDEPIELTRPEPQQQMNFLHGEATERPRNEVVQVTRDGDKVGRNDPCPCGSGKKYKKCHG